MVPHYHLLCGAKEQDARQEKDVGVGTAQARVVENKDSCSRVSQEDGGRRDARLQPSSSGLPWTVVLVVHCPRAPVFWGVGVMNGG